MMFTAHAILGAIGACWVYYDAKKRGHNGRSAILWAAGVLLEIIIFLPMYLLFGRKPRPKPVPALKETNNANIIDVEALPIEETVQCPMCSGRVKEDFKLCPYCGHSLRPKCRNCGENLDRAWRACPYCQTPADDK